MLNDEYGIRRFPYVQQLKRAIVFCLLSYLPIHKVLIEIFVLSKSIWRLTYLSVPVPNGEVLLMIIVSCRNFLLET